MVCAVPLLWALGLWARRGWASVGLVWGHIPTCPTLHTNPCGWRDGVSLTAQPGHGLLCGHGMGLLSDNGGGQKRRQEDRLFPKWLQHLPDHRLFSRYDFTPPPQSSGVWVSFPEWSGLVTMARVIPHEPGCLVLNGDVLSTHFSRDASSWQPATTEESHLGV